MLIGDAIMLSMTVIVVGCGVIGGIALGIRDYGQKKYVEGFDAGAKIACSLRDIQQIIIKPSF